MTKRTREWGDDASEQDADAALAEFEVEAQLEGRKHRWHDHWSLVPFKVVAQFIGRNAKRVAVTIAGFGLLLAGIALLVLPGPGWLLIFLGLGVLATEYVWAQRLLKQAKRRAEQAKDLALRRKDSRAEKKELQRSEKPAPKDGPAA
jgi:uncharacterized protein (TIGR02611 family)